MAKPEVGQVWRSVGSVLAILGLGYVLVQYLLCFDQFAYHLGNLLEVRFQFSRTGVRPEILYFFWFGSLKGNVI